LPQPELGAGYVDQINAAQLKRYFVKRLENLGLQITVQDIEKAAPTDLKCYFPERTQTEVQCQASL
jgi:hypothetical protein